MEKTLRDELCVCGHRRAAHCGRDHAEDCSADGERVGKFCKCGKFRAAIAAESKGEAMPRKKKEATKKEKVKKAPAVFVGLAPLREEAAKIDSKTRPSQRASIIKVIAKAGEGGATLESIVDAVKDSKANRESVESMVRSVRTLLSKMGAEKLVARRAAA